MNEEADGTVGYATAVNTALREREWTIGVAESLTGGLLTSALVEIPGSSAVLNGGLVVYHTALKHSLLGVDVDLLTTHGPVHPEVAAQMADGVRAATRVEGRPADVGVATTGIAGPASPDGQPVGTVWIGIATPEGSVTERYDFDGDRGTIRAQAVRAALALLVKTL